ncbi:hypothetical protein CNO08_04985 [Lysobacter capsici]|nr:hypothetical protein CNO08_04985 [Lysobacter capsici]
MEKVLDNHGLLGQVQVDFLGAREIANWAEQFPPIAIWIRQAIGDPLTGWKSYGPWAYREESTDALFVPSEAPRVYPPTATDVMTDLEGINAIRADLQAGESVRLIGLSGVGKTRLAQALFDPRIGTSAPALSRDQAIYTDMSDQPAPSPTAMTEILRSTQKPAILIVDNCGQATHTALVEKKGRTAKAIGLLTIEYDIRDDIPDETRCYRLEGSSDRALWSVLQSHYPDLSQSDLTTLVAASQGNARLAFALASTSKQTGDLASLRSDELFRRLFEQKHGPGDELLRCAKAASLVYSFDGEDLSPGSEMALLAAFAQVSVVAFRANMAEIQRRGLLQERKQWRALLPHALSNRLATEALKDHAPDEIQDRLFLDAPERIQASFANRLSYLHSSPVAQAIVGGWLAPDGELGDIGDLSDHGFLIFQRVAVVAPPATLLAIERFVALGEIGDLSEYSIDTIVHITQSIAYEPLHFDRCVDALLKLLLMQREHKSAGRDNLKHLSTLFQAYRSGTLTPASQRATHISRLLTSSTAYEQEAGIELLVAALKVQDFYSPDTFQFGAHARTQGCRPENEEERRAWYEEFLAIAEPLAVKDDPVGRALRAALGRAIPGFVCDTVLMGHLRRLAPRFLQIDRWLPGLKAINQLIADGEVSGELLDRALDLKALITPTNLSDQVIVAIGMRDPYEYAEETDVDTDIYNTANEDSEALGRQLAAEPALLSKLMPRLMSDRAHRLALPIGQGVASATNDAHALFAQIRRQASSAPDIRFLSSYFASGVFKGWHEKDPTLAAGLLDDVLSDALLGKWFIHIQNSVPLDHLGVERILASIEIGYAPIADYLDLGHGGYLKPATITDVTRILNALSKHGPRGTFVALDVLHLVLHSASERTIDEQALLGKFCLYFMTNADWPEAGRSAKQIGHEISRIIAFTTKHSNTFDDVRVLLRRITNLRNAEDHAWRAASGSYLYPILRKYPQEALNHLLEQSVLDQNDRISDMVVEARMKNREGHEISIMGTDALISWCAKAPGERVQFCAQICPLNEHLEPAQSAFARLYELAPDKPSLIQALLGRAMRSGSSTRMMPIINACIHILDGLPVFPGSPEDQACRSATKTLRDRVEWRNQMLASMDQDRDEGFE